MRILYRGDWPDDMLTNAAPAQAAPVTEIQGRAVVSVELPPAGMAILA